MNIGLDLDGVVYPWHDSIFRYFREYKSFEGGARDFWNYFKALPYETQSYYVSIPILYLDSIPSNETLLYVNKLAELGDLYYITHRHTDLQWATRKFFDMYSLPFKENLIFTKEKANYIRLNNIVCFADDLAKNVDELLPVTDAYLFKAVHNWEDTDSGKYNVVNNMKHYYETVKEKYG